MADLQVQNLPVDKIKSAIHQARTNFDPHSIADLAKSMQGPKGLIQPITVRLLADGTWELVAGERRLRAAKSLGWTTINALVVPDVNDQDAAEMGLIENLQREDLNPVEEAKGFAQLQEMDKKKWTQEEIAKRVGKERTYVTERLSLLDLPTEVQENVERSTFSAGHADALLRLKTPEQQREMAQKVVTEGWSVKETEKKVNEALGKSPKEPKSSKTPENPNLNDPIESIGYRMHELNIPKHKGYFYVDRDYKGKYQWSFTTSPNWVRDQKDPPDATPPALAQELARALHEMAAAFEQAAGPVIIKTTADQNGGQPEGRLTGESASGSPIEKENLSPPVGLADARVSRSPGQPLVPPSKPRAGIIPQRASVPVPQLEAARYVAGNKLELKWSSLGEGFTYRLFRSYDTDYPKYMPFADDAVVSTPGALIDVRPDVDEKSQKIAVMAIDGQGQESELSEGIEFELKPWNQHDSVSPLPTAAVPAPEAPKPARDPKLQAMIDRQLAKGRIIR